MDSTRAGNNNVGNKNGNVNGNTNMGGFNGNVNGNNNRGSDNDNVNGNVNNGAQNGNFNGNGNKGSNNGNGSGNGNKGNVNGSNNANRNKGSGNGNSKYVCAAEALTPFARKPFFIRRFCRPDRAPWGFFEGFCEAAAVVAAAYASGCSETQRLRRGMRFLRRRWVADVLDDDAGSGDALSHTHPIARSKEPYVITRRASRARLSSRVYYVGRLAARRTNPLVSCACISGEKN